MADSTQQPQATASRQDDPAEKGPFLGLDVSRSEAWLLAAGWAVLFGSFVIRLLTLRLTLFDTAVTANVYWRLAHGYDDVSPLVGTHHLGDHLSITGLALTPAFLGGTVPGLVVYGALQAASAVLVSAAVLTAGRALGLEVSRRRLLAALTYLAPGTYLVAHFGIREYALGIGPLAMAAALSLRNDAGRPLAGWAWLAALTRVEFAISILLVGLLARPRDARKPLVVAGAVTTTSFLLWLLVGPLEGASTGAHFGHLGASLSEVVVTAVSDPGRALAPLLEGDWLRAFVGWLLPFGLVWPLLRLRAMAPTLPFLITPVMGTWALADGFPEHYWHPLLAFGSLAVVQMMASAKPRVARLALATITAGLLLSWLIMFPWSLGSLRPGLSVDTDAADAIADLREGSGSLAATVPLVHQLLDRPVVFALPDPFVCESLSGSERGPTVLPQTVAGPNDSIAALERLSGLDLSSYDRIEMYGGYSTFATGSAGVSCR